MDFEISGREAYTIFLQTKYFLMLEPFPKQSISCGNHCLKSVQIRSFFWSVFSCIRTEYGDLLFVFSPNTGKYGPEYTPYLDTFHVVNTVGFNEYVFNFNPIRDGKGREISNIPVFPL